MKVEKYIESLQEELGKKLISVVLFGSAVYQENKPEQIDLLVILDALEYPELKAINLKSKSWIKKNGKAPMLFSKDRFLQSDDSFPIEILDIKQNYQVLFGEDLIAEMEVCDKNLRLQLEHELRGKLIQLRESYLYTGGKAKDVERLIYASMSSFITLGKAFLRLKLEGNPPNDKLEIIHLLAEHCQLDESLLIEIFEYKAQKKSLGSFVTESYFERYLTEIGKLVDCVDAL